MANKIVVVCWVCQQRNEVEADEALHGDSDLYCRCGASLGKYQDLGLGPVERLKRNVERQMNKAPKPPKAGSYRNGK